MNTAQRRHALKDTLIAIAETRVAAEGLAAIKARDLAAEAGCSVGAIYNVFDDLDDLSLAVNDRTLDLMAAELSQSMASGASQKQAGAETAIRQMTDLAIAYLRFAQEHTGRWRALFEHRRPAGEDIPDWYAERQRQLFTFIEYPLRSLLPDWPDEALTSLARSAFSAVHGVVTLGLEEKLGALPGGQVEKQVRSVVMALGHGMPKLQPDGI